MYILLKDRRDTYGKTIRFELITSLDLKRDLRFIISFHNAV